ncbi:GDYXXLXY domain-containing protein [Alloalcanivorax mobilis]|uniref:GDYXXLXY domain-containing protein n=1 Tax=Alloalcanivorax mobilis TaxID=2019569 RepID=UPI000C76EBAD|nr:GDYXXLXY domain-containing protein [Alloalcanivorax mobilis]
MSKTISQRRRIDVVIAALVPQALILLALLGYSLYPLWSGREIVLRTAPVDPRDLFRGQYVQLRYEINQAPMPEVGVPRVGRQVFVQLESQDGVWQAVETRYTPPPGLFLRGHITSIRTGSVGVDYGIGAWFAPPEQARALERQLRAGALARLRVADNGQAALIGVEPLPEPPPSAPPE